MEISKLVDKIEKELATRSEQLDARETSLNERAGQLESRAIELEEKEKALVVREESLAPELARIAKIEKKLKDEKAIAKELADTIQAKERAQKLNEEAQAALGETKQVREEVAKRELALSEREKTYKDQVEREIMQKFLRG